jgi:RNA polymerase II elongation factor ELL
MNAAKENLHHELYIRAASAAKRNAPLKLHAHVVGKFQVERQLDNDVRSRLRHSTKTLQVQRQERGIIQLEAPLAPLPKSSKKAAAARPAHLLVDQAASSSRESTFLSNRSRKEPSKSVRRRMIQLLAVSDRTSEEILRLLGGPDCSSSDRSDLLDLLEQASHYQATLIFPERSG